MSRSIPILAVALALAATSHASAQRAGETPTNSEGQNQQQQRDYSESDSTQQEQLPNQPYQDRAGTDNEEERNGASGDRSARRQQQDFDLGARFTDAEDALTVGTVREGSIAADIGLRQNDQVIAVGERAVFTQEDFNRALRRSRTSRERIPVIVRRDSGRTTLYIEPDTLRESFGIMGRPDAPTLGVTLAPNAADQLIVRDVTGGIGSRLGLRANDVVLSVGGRRVFSPAEFERLIYDVDFATGRPLPVIVVRDGRRMTLQLEADGAEYGFREEGFYRDEGAWLGVTLDTSYDNAAVVQSVVSDSPAAEAGVRPGDWIVRIDGRRIQSPRHLTSLVRSMTPGEQLEIEIARRVSRTLTARLDADPTLEPRQALRPIYDSYDGEDDPPAPPLLDRPDPPIDPDLDRRGLRDRLGPDERGLRDRLDADEAPDEPRGVLPR
jgi:S1-C subfamily serine protease